MNILNIIPLDNYILRVSLSDGKVYDFNVLSEINRIPSYRILLNIEYFKLVKFDLDRIYWGDIFGSIDFHIDQVISRGVVLN
jgi:hypothetical protein